MVHECPHCGSHTITCRHCSWTWNPRDPENIPDTCPRCRNKWDVPFKWTVKSQKYGHGTVDPKIYALAREAMKELMNKKPLKFVDGESRKQTLKMAHRFQDQYKPKPKKQLKELSA